MNRLYILIILSSILATCSSTSVVKSSMNDNDAVIKIAIEDFIHSVKGGNSDNVYHVYSKSMNGGLLGVSIDGTNDKVVVITKDRVNFDYTALPTGYIDRDGKLFYWRDSVGNTSVSKEMISSLKHYGILDTLVIGAIIPESTISHNKKSTHYYFCKKDISKYKSVRTLRAMGYYDPPGVRCD